MPCRKALATGSWLFPSSRESRVVLRPILPGSAARMRLFSSPVVRSIPLQCSLLPDVSEPDKQDHHEYEHFTEAEERDVSGRTDIVHHGDGARQLLVVNAPRNHEYGLDIEDDKENCDEVELD